MATAFPPSTCRRGRTIFASAAPIPAVLRLDLPPPAAAVAALPDGFGRRFAIFADAEEEFDWSRGFDREATATTAIRALPEANRRFTERGIIPTYLVDYPVADRAESGAIIAALAQAGACDVGAQLHPWVTPPHVEDVNACNSFHGNLPMLIEAEKIAAITNRLRDLTGRFPVAFRAGRYGVGPATGRLLARAGYRLDVSTRPLFDYQDQGGPDFTRHPLEPWWCSRDLLEVPLSAAHVGPLRRLRLPRHPLLRGALSRARLLGRVALTPEGIPLDEARRGIDALLKDGIRLLSLSFHTPSLVPGHTPYVRDAADLACFWRWWDGVLDHLDRAGVQPVRPAGIVAAADAARLASAGREPLSTCAGPVAQG